MAIEKPVEPSPLDTDEIPIVVPLEVPRPAWSRTWTLGGITVVLAVCLAVTGLGLMFFYQPLVAVAHLSLTDLAETSRLDFLRVLHRWSSHAILIATALHLFLVVVTAAYRPPRHLNYQVGVGLGILMLVLAVTGHILPWDERSQWLMERLALDPDDSVLAVVHAAHCGILPAAMVVLIVYHLRRARRDDAAETEA